MWARELIGFELKKIILPAVLIVIFFFSMLVRSSYGPAVLERLGQFAASIMNGMHLAYTSLIGTLRPGMVATTPVDDVFFLIVLIAGGYLASSGIFFLHRHNRAVYLRGKKMFLVVFLFMAAAFWTINSRYAFFETVIASFVMGYLLTSFVCGVYDLLRTNKIRKKVKKQKTLAKYFRWEFRYLK